MFALNVVSKYLINLLTVKLTMKRLQTTPFKTGRNLGNYTWAGKKDKCVEHYARVAQYCKSYLIIKKQVKKKMVKAKSYKKKARHRHR